MNGVFKVLTGIQEQLMKKRDEMLIVGHYTSIHAYQETFLLMNIHLCRWKKASSNVRHNPALIIYFVAVDV